MSEEKLKKITLWGIFGKKAEPLPQAEPTKKKKKTEQEEREEREREEVEEIERESRESSEEDSQGDGLMSEGDILFPEEIE